MKKENDLKKQMIVFIKFCIVGVSNTLIGYLIYLLTLFLLKGFHTEYDVYIGNTTSFILSVLWSFLWNNKFVFKVKEGETRNIWKALLKTYLCYAFSGIILTNVLSFCWMKFFGIPKTFAPLLCLPITVPTNFILNKIWAFRAKKKEENVEKEEE